MSTCSSSFLLNRGGRPRRRKNTRRFSALLAVPEMPQSYKSVYVMERDWVVFCWQAVLLARAALYNQIVGYALDAEQSLLAGLGLA